MLRVRWRASRGDAGIHAPAPGFYSRVRNGAASARLLSFVDEGAIVPGPQDAVVGPQDVWDEFLFTYNGRTCYQDPEVFNHEVSLCTDTVGSCGLGAIFGLELVCGGMASGVGSVGFVLLWNCGGPVWKIRGFASGLTRCFCLHQYFDFVIPASPGTTEIPGFKVFTS